MRDFIPLAEALLRLQGCPVGRERRLWTQAGVHALLAELPSLPPGSLGELRCILGLFDKDVRVILLGPIPGQYRNGSPSEGPVGLAGSQPILELHVLWRCHCLLPQAHPLKEAVARIINWWTPVGFGETRWHMNWEGAVLALSPRTEEEENPVIKPAVHQLMEVYAEKFLGIKRKPAAPPRTLICLAVEEYVRKEPGEVVLSGKAAAGRGLERFLANAEPIMGSWKVVQEQSGSVEGELTLTALTDSVRRLEVLATARVDGASWTLDGRELKRRPIAEWPELFSFDLPAAVAKGQSVNLRCVWPRPAKPAVLRGRPPRQIKLYANPVLFQAAAWKDAEGLFEPAFDGGGDAPRTYPDIVSGAEGIVQVEQPLRVSRAQPGEEDAAFFARASEVLLGRLARRNDLARLVADRFPGAGPVSCEASEWFDEGPPARLVRGVRVALHPQKLTELQGDRLCAAIHRYLEDRLLPTFKPHVFVETNHG